MQTKNKKIGSNQFYVLPHILESNILIPEYQTKLKRKNYPQKNIFTVKKLLTHNECDQLIELSEHIGFQKAGLAIKQDVYRSKEKTRNNQRVLFEDINMASTLWNRVHGIVDSKFDNYLVKGLNWRFRIYKYEKGGIFAPHVDERMVLENGSSISLFTFMIYLNDNLSGGETTFFDRRKKGQKKLLINRVIKPQKGMALAFDHQLFHEGSVVTSGIKYVLRSDILYSKKR